MQPGDSGGGGPRHVVYILDLSGSMTSRIDRARLEIALSIRGLRADDSFGIVTFADDASVYRTALVPATPAWKSDAERYLQSLTLGVRTNLEAALRSAFAYPDVNMVVLLTDGVPTTGEQNWKKLEKLARNLDRGRASIYTFGLVGKNPDGTDDSFEATQLLQTLSRESGGEAHVYSVGVATGG
jgi:Mg-chelatase subunit ChlD